MTLETIAPFSEDPLVGGGVIALSGGLAGFCQAATTGSRSYNMPWGTIVAGRAMKTAVDGNGEIAMATPRIIFIAAALVAAVFPAPAMSQAHVAASITYEETPRPKGLPDELQPLPDVRLRFLSISAIDGFKIAAALWQPRAKPAASTTLLVQVHGSGGSFASVQLRATARTLSAQGFAALSISTRQHDENVNTDNFDLPLHGTNPCVI